MNIIFKIGMGIVSAVFSIALIAVLVVAALFHFGIRHESKDTTSYEDTVSGVTSIDMNIDAAEIQIKEGTEFHVEASNVPEGSFTSSVKGGTWNIDCDWKTTSYIRIFGIKIPVHGSSSYNHDLRITVTIPKGFHAENLNVDLGAGSLEAKTLIADDANIDIGAGSMEIDTLTVYNSSYYNIGAGELSIHELTAKDVTVDCGVGKVNINGYITGENNIDCGIGEVVFNLYAKESDYNYTVTCGIGEVSIGNRTQVSADDMTIDNDQEENNFTLNCGIGSIDMDFQY